MWYSRLFDYCRRLPIYLYRLEDALLVLILSGMILLATAQIIMRNFFDSGLVWVDPLLRILVLWLALLGAMVAGRMDKHIRMDLLSKVIPKRFSVIAKVVVNLFAAVIAGIVAWHAWRFVQFDYLDKVMAFASVPAWIAELIIPLTFAVIAVRFFILAFSQLVGVMQRETSV